MKKETQGCKYCGYEKTSKRTKKPFDEFIKELKESRGDEFTYVSGYNGASSKAIFRHHMKDGSHHDFKMVPKNLINGTYYCPCCSGYQIYIGYNDFNTRRPELVKYLLNPEEGTKYSEYSNHILEWKCPDCGNILKKRISEVSTRGICCPRCSDGISYPNKFMYNSLLQIKDYLNYIEREFRPDWCKYTYNEKECFGVYDIYFEKDNKKYIVEMDGGLGHGNRTYTKSDKSKDELLDIDKIKDLLAKEHDIEVIRINCDYGSNDRYSFILNEVLNSKLSSILNLSLIDFKKSNILSQQSLLLKTVELWNDGYSVGKISSEIGVFSDTVTHYLKSAQKYGICNTYSIKESRNRSISNKIVCITTNKEFDSIVDGAKFYNTLATSVSKCCRHKAGYAGYYNGQKLIWMYKTEYDNFPKEKLKDYVPKEDNNYTKVVCLNTGEIFDGIIYAAEKYGVLDSGTTACCSKTTHYSGKDSDGNILVWRYLDEYKQMTKEEINTLLSYKSMGKKKVICLNTLQIFDNAYEASVWCGLNNKLILQSCCRNEVRFAGVHPDTGEKLNWLYYKDYLKEKEAA